MDNKKYTYSHKEHFWVEMTGNCLIVILGLAILFPEKEFIHWFAAFVGAAFVLSLLYGMALTVLSSIEDERNKLD
jgi:hypothetical protein